MTLTPGARLGPYEITGKLGEGGMGEVYRATDTRLQRAVAIKVLPAAFTEDKERLQRFEREAQLLAQLHHPSIASIFGMEDSGETKALVMELVEGPTLADRLDQGSLSIEESLSIARQIAEALEEAHEKGIVHRDLKPQNIKASIEGKVKVLDFGLAKAMDPVGTASGAPSGSQLAASPTLTLGATVQGVILGTAAYMSPEQAKGLPVDKRADIWAFGVVLYEMLVGGTLFAGDTVGDTLAAVIRKDVDLEQLPDDTPAALRRLLRRCLERNPRNRLHSIADARIVIDEILGGRFEEPAATGAEVGTAAGRSPRVLVAAVVAALAVGGVAGWLLRPAPSVTPAEASRWALALPDGYVLSTADTPQLAISRDGRLQAAVVVDEKGLSQVLLRRNDAFEPELLAGTEGATSPFFSPDSEWLGFFSGAALMKIPVAGGPVIRVAPVVSVDRGGAWSPDGSIFFVAGYGEPVSRVAEAGLAPEKVTRLDETRQERTHRWPSLLADGSALIYTSDTVASTEYYDDARIEAVRPATGERRVLVEGASQAWFVPGGYLVFARGGALYAVELDPGSLSVRGTPVQVATGVATNVGSGAVQFAVSESGAALWSPGGLSSAAYRVVRVDRDGIESSTAVPPAPYNELALSPDGRRVALVGGQGGVSDLWVTDLERGGTTRLLTGEFVLYPVWTPDSRRIAYAVRSRDGGPGAPMRIDWIPADGSRPPETLVAKEFQNSPDGFTPDGGALLFDRSVNEDSGVSADLWRLPLDGDRTPRPWLEDPGRQYGAQVSPDGSWAAYVSAESGNAVVYVRPYPEGPGRWQISTGIGVEPRWGPDGRFLYYREASVLLRVPIDTSNGFSAGRPEPVLDRVASGGQVMSYSIAADGSGILTFRTPEGSGAQRQLYLDLGFADRVARAVGTRK